MLSLLRLFALHGLLFAEVFQHLLQTCLLLLPDKERAIIVEDNVMDEDDLLMQSVAYFSLLF